MVVDPENINGRNRTTNWDKYRLLMWKNWKLGLRNKWSLLKEIGTPVLFSVIILLTRHFILPGVIDQDLIYPKLFPNNVPEMRLNADSNNLTMNWDLWYSPSSAQLDLFMANITAELELDVAIPFATEDELIAQLEDSEEYPFACVVFDDDLRNTSSLPDHLIYDIRFPSKRRWGNGNWNTDRTFRTISPSVVRAPLWPNGNSPYIMEGFNAIQHVISMHFIEMKRSGVQTVPQVWLRRQPFPETKMDYAVNLMGNLLSAVLIIAFLPMSMNMTKLLAVEKEQQLKELMKIMGLPNWLHWTSWFSKFAINMVLVVTMMTVLFKVPFHGGVSIFTHSHFTTIWLFLFTYAVSVIMFSFLISTLIKSPGSASLVAGVLMFILYIPYFVILNLGASLDRAEVMGLSLFNSLGMAFGFKYIMKLEDHRTGLQWSNMFAPIEFADDVSVGWIMVILVVSCLVMLLLTLYFEKINPGAWGLAEKWYFPVMPSYWCSWFRSSSPNSKVTKDFASEIRMEDMPEDNPVGINIANLRKVYDTGNVAVQGLNLTMFEGEITVLLGHNGAGKTTTISMLTGMIPATSGTAIINGHDIYTDMDSVRDEMGICPQHNILFDELTVAEHLQFYSRLKGLSHIQATEEIDKYVKQLQLGPKLNAPASTLSGGMKRKLCIGVALCGNSKIVLLDEPTAGMDPTARRALWDLMQVEKKSRTIILSTHFMDEADVLGDRIAIMHEGRLKCYGSSFYLKKEFGAGYCLTFEKERNCDIQAVYNTLKAFIPEVSLTGNVGTELTFNLPDRYSHKFEPMLREIEDNSTDLGILGYGISVTTLEEVFLTIGSDNHHNIIQNAPSVETLPLQDSEAGSTVSVLDSPRAVSRVALIRNHWYSMFLKHYFYALRNYSTTILKLLTPTIFMLLTMAAISAFDRVRVLPALPIELSLFDFRTHSLIGRNFTDDNELLYKFMDRYASEVERTGAQHTSRRIEEDVGVYLLRIARRDFAKFTRHYVVSASVDEEDIVAWFSNQYYHTAPVSLQLVYNALLAAATNSDKYRLTLRNYPLPFTRTDEMNFSDNSADIGFQIMLNMGSGMVLVMALYIMYYIKERTSKAKLLQFVSGVNVWTFWLVSIIWDYLHYLLSVGLMIGILVVFQQPSWYSGDDRSRIFVLFVSFAVAAFPMVYLFSMLNNDAANGFTNLAIFGFGCIILFVLTQQMRLPIVDLVDAANILDALFMLLPLFALPHALFHMNQHNTLVQVCYRTCALTGDCLQLDDLCQSNPECCNLNSYSWKTPGIGRNICVLVLVGVILFVVLGLKELGYIKRWSYCGAEQMENIQEDMEEDSDVTAEKKRVRRMTPGKIQATNLVVTEMSKHYKDFQAVKSLNFAVDESECFGLLGVNGAGKTSTFKMLTGDEDISSGDAWVRGHSLRGKLSRVYPYIGYCPQFDAVLPDLTGRETMMIFCLLRGISVRHVDKYIQKLANDLNFAQHLHKQISAYSGGNKRKVSTALALIGDPSVIFLDEPTAGMDPGAKRNLWDVLSRVRDTGTTIVLTSHSMEECEALCTRLTVMVNGQFMCMGSLQHLKNKFSKGFVLTVQVSRLKTLGAANAETDVRRLHDYVLTNLDGAVLKEDYQGRMTYYIDNRQLKWSTMFGIMETAKRTLAIENYSLTQTTLEQIFLDFAQLQES